MSEQVLAFEKVLVVPEVAADTVPSDSLFAEKGQEVVPGSMPWNMESYTGKAGADSKPVLLRVEFDAPETGKYRFGMGADWWFRCWVDGKLLLDGEGDTPPGPEDHWGIAELTKGKHCLDVHFTRGDASADLNFSILPLGNFEECVDLSGITGKIRKEHHGSNTTLILSSRNLNRYEDPLRKLNFTWARTHDWPLWNAGQRIIDTHFIFPLMHEDPKDPKNYCFKVTDEIIRLTQEVAGIKVFYRLGTSIEHTGSPHFNIIPPEDPEKYAEVLAGIVRHYTKGWADGFHYDIPYWEIWNEPEGQENMWDAPYAETFPPFFATVLKRLKQEFPELQFGGPAMCGATIRRFVPLMAACRKAGVAPDFVSWHLYTSDAKSLINTPVRMRNWLDSQGFPNTKLCINEWHYLESWQGVQSVGGPAEYRKILSMLQGIDSGVFNLAVLAGWQETPLDLGMWYGSSWDSPNWGYRNAWHEFTKNYWSLALFGQFIRDYTEKCSARIYRDSHWYFLAGRSADGTKAGILVADYKGTGTEIRFPVKGMETCKKVSALVLDETRNNEPVPVSVCQGEVVLRKAAPGSAAFLVMLEK